MSNPILRVLSGTFDSRRIVETVVPQRTLDDVVLPPATRRSLDQALAHVTQHDLIFNRWGLRERHRPAWRWHSTSQAHRVPARRFAPKRSLTHSAGDS
jgi:hypothetical protein